MTKFCDPLDPWSEPETISQWAKGISPPPENAWLDYISLNVHPDAVNAIGRLLLPAFVEHDGGVFLRDRFTLSSYSIWKAQLGELTAVEKMFNHQHIYDLFATDEKIEDRSFEALAMLMSKTIRLALGECFPDRKFNVYFSNSEQDYGPVVGFYSFDANQRS